MTLATGWDDSTTTAGSLLRTFVHARADSQAEALGAPGLDRFGQRFPGSRPRRPRP